VVKNITSLLKIRKFQPKWQLAYNLLSNLEVTNQRKQWITVKVSELEMRAIEAYCQQTQRTKTDVLRELIRRLPTYTNASNFPNSYQNE
jgi:hypothetical protein